MWDVTANETLWTLVQRWANQRAREAAIVFLEDQERPESLLTFEWERVADAVLDLRQRLAALGVGNQRTAIVALPPSPLGLVTWLAVASNGAILQAVDPEGGVLPMRTAIAATNPVVLIGLSTNAATVTKAVAESGSRAVAIIADDLSLSTPVGAIPGLAQRSTQVGPASPDGIAGLLPTSGTSGTPKLVELTHRNYITAGERLARNSGHTHRDRFYLCSPFFHVNAQMYSCMPALVTGGSIAVVPRFSAGRYFDTARLTGATVSSMVAPPLRMALYRARERGGPVDPGDLRLIQYGMSMSEADWAVWDQMFPQIEMRQVYGQTESVSAVLGGAPWEHDDRRMIGRPFLGVDGVRLVDDDGRDVADGVQGELWVRGEPGRTLMRGYWRNPEATAAAIDSEGWLRTGDIMIRQADGRLAFVGRRLHIVRRAGENLSTYELELMMQSCPLIEDVAIQAEPDPMLGARLVVHVIPGQGFSEDALNAWCREAIGRRGVPDVIKVHKSFPRTGSGRVLVRELE